MADKAILFDSSRCTGCKQCQMACKAGRGTWVVEQGSVRRGGVSPFAPDVDGDTLLAVTYAEHRAGSKGFQYEYGRKSCMHCGEAACVSACPTSSMAVDERTGLVVNDIDRCVSCGMCQNSCPFDIPRPEAGGTRIVKCDGCTDRVVAGDAPLCAGACPVGALLFDDREAVLAEAEQRAAALQEKGYPAACVFGATEQGGLRVIEVLKYGPAGARGEHLADTGANSLTSDMPDWVGPASVGALGVLTLSGIGAIGYGMKRQKRYR